MQEKRMKNGYMQK